jgi:hypothetical protein
LIKQILAAALTVSCCLAPEREVKNNVLTSEHDPTIRIEFPGSVQYVGADRWVLLGIADCELHAFVEADKEKNVQHLYWVQFEGYLPNRPELHHTYDSPRHATIGGLDFYVDTSIKAGEEKSEPDSDGEHIRSLISDHQYKMPKEMMSVRLVHLLDAEKRKELMIIYGEALTPTGFTAADLGKNGKGYNKWPIIESDLIERAKKSLKLEDLPSGTAKVVK